MTAVVVAQSSSLSTIASPTTSLRSSSRIIGNDDDDGGFPHVLPGVSSNSSRFTRRLPRSLASFALHPFREDPSDTDTNSEEEEDETFRKRRKGGGSSRRGGGGGGGGVEDSNNFSVLALFVTAIRKSVGGCYNNNNSSHKGGDSLARPSSVSESESSFSSSHSSRCSSSSSCSSSKMEISVPTNVRHVAHVTFDRFNGFLGLPVEFEPEVPRRAPSASAKVFGVSTNSMQLSFDSRGNSVPTILLMMQHRLYALGGLEVEGIFRINAGNDQEEYVRNQLNHGVVPDDADVHCLAGLIKAWFRELPIGLLDPLSTEQLMESQTEEDCAHLARHLPPTEASLLDWAVNLMADIVQHQHLNKMNARNVAVVFAPNMTHVMDPLTALMHAVQVMNFLKTLIIRTLREREDSILDDAPPPRSSIDQFEDSSSSSRPQTPLQTILEGITEGIDEDNRNNRSSCLDKKQSSSRRHLPTTTKPDDTPSVFQLDSTEENKRPSDEQVRRTRASSCRVKATGKPCDNNRKVGGDREAVATSTVDKDGRKNSNRMSQLPVAAVRRVARGSNGGVGRRNPGGEIIESWR